MIEMGHKHDLLVGLLYQLSCSDLRSYAHASTSWGPKWLTFFLLWEFSLVWEQGGDCNIQNIRRCVLTSGSSQKKQRDCFYVGVLGKVIHLKWYMIVEVMPQPDFSPCTSLSRRGSSLWPNPETGQESRRQMGRKPGDVSLSLLIPHPKSAVLLWNTFQIQGQEHGPDDKGWEYRKVIRRDCTHLPWNGTVLHSGSWHHCVQDPIMISPTHLQLHLLPNLEPVTRFLP